MSTGLVAYSIRRLLQLVPLLFVVVVLNFTLIHMAPGDPAYAIAGQNAPPSYLATVRERYGLERPIIVQLLRYVQRLTVGDLGYSYLYQRPVLTVILQRVPATLALMLTSMTLAFVVGIVLAIYSARYYGNWLDNLLSAASLTIYSIPVFWIGLILIFLFSIRLGWLPSSGMANDVGSESPLAYVGDILSHMILPVATLVAYYLPAFYRVTRASALKVATEEFVRLARAVGFSETTIYYRYILKNALLPSISLAGLTFGLSLSGALLTETVFSWPGIGRLMLDAANNRDYPTMMGIFIVTAICVVVANLVADIVMVRIDPRIVYD